VLFAQTQSRALFRGPDGHSLFVACARLDNRSELADAIGLFAHDLACTSDESLLFRLFARWGSDGVARCVGAFAFAHWDARARRLILGRDCLGHCPLLFHRRRDGVVFSNRLGALLAMPEVPREVDDIGLANLLVVNGHDRYRTAYRGIERTPARHLLTIDRSGLRSSPYWSPDLTPLPYRHDEDYVERARELFDEAVISATAGATDVAVAASGGLDSSAVAATAARLGRATRIHCFTTLPPDDADVPLAPHLYRDERDKMEALGRMYPALELNWLSRSSLHPFEVDESRYFSLALLPRRNGITLGGAGMLFDALSAHPLVLFGSRGNLCLSWMGLTSLLALLRSNEWLRFAKELSAVARHSGRSKAQVLYADVVRRGAPPRLRALWRRLHGRGPGSVARYAALNPDFMAQAGLAELWRRQGFDSGYEMAGSTSAQLRAWELFDRAGPQGDNAGWLEQAYGIASRDPFADRRLLEFALAVPEPLYRRNGVPRSFARAVFADRLPREILQETRRGANNLAWFRTLDRRRAQIAAQLERIESSATAQRLLDIPRLKRLLDDWPKDERAAHARGLEYRLALARAVHVGNFICWVEGGMAG
jgi:asparagine synthase (glutamine-hydrolysing)